MALTITHKNNQALLGDKNHLELAEQKSFSDLVFEVLSEKEPNPLQSRVFNLILNLAIDHGVDTPSTAATIKAKRKTISEAVAAGVMQINDSHGGAIEPAMNFLYRIKEQNLDIAKEVEGYLSKKKLIAGFGHRLYKEVDPRAELIFRTMVEVNLGFEYIGIMRQVREELIKRGKNIPINIDGAIAAALCSFGWNPRLGKAVFIIARMPGLCAHYLNNT